MQGEAAQVRVEYRGAEQLDVQVDARADLLGADVHLAEDGADLCGLIRRTVEIRDEKNGRMLEFDGARRVPFLCMGCRHIPSTDA